MNLPDIYVWLSLATELHPHHGAARRWIASVSREDRILFCRLSQLGLLRHLSSAAVMANKPLTQRAAWHVYDRFLEDPRIGFVDEVAELETVFRRISSRGEASPKRWTDDYLAAFAEAASLTLITFDRALAARVPAAILLTP